MTTQSDFIYGDFIDKEICDGLLEFWQRQEFLPVSAGESYSNE